MDTIVVHELIANVLPIAFPPTVTPATSADIISETILGHVKSKLCSTCAAMVADAEPDTTPQISPTTSLQMELTRSALRKRRIASMLPGTFLEAIEWKGFSSADVTATPITSKMIPSKTIANSIKKATGIVLESIIMSETKEIVPETMIVTIKMETTQRIVLFRAFFNAEGSDLDNSVSPFCVLMTVADRINLTA